VIPTRDRWPLLSAAALRGALVQEGVDHEVIVVDDGSTDDTADQLAALAGVEPRLRVIRHESSRGVAQARNAGVAAARGEWIAFLDDDDLWSPRKLRLQIDAATAAGAGFAYAGVAWVDERYAFLFAIEPPDAVTLTSSLLRWNVMWGGCSNVIARADLVREVGAFDEELFQLADWDLWIRLTLAAPAAVAPELLVGYVMQCQSMLLTDRRDVFREFEYLVRKHAAAAAAHGVGPDPARFARWVAFGHLRAGRRRKAAATYLRGRDAGGVLRALGALGGEQGFRAARALVGAIRRPRERRLATLDPPWLGLYRRRDSSSSAT
jgi:hypothetical protein